MNNMDDFQRDISFRLERRDTTTVLVKSLMTDRFHDICLEAVVDLATLSIIGIRVQFHKCPTHFCQRAEAGLQQLVGVPIGKGLTRTLFAALGGSAGCPNLRNMLLCALPLVLNHKAAEGIGEIPEMMETIHHQLQGTCSGYTQAAETK